MTLSEFIAYQKEIHTHVIVVNNSLAHPLAVMPITEDIIEQLIPKWEEQYFSLQLQRNLSIKDREGKRAYATGKGKVSSIVDSEAHS